MFSQAPVILSTVGVLHRGGSLHRGGFYIREGLHRGGVYIQGGWADSPPPLDTTGYGQRVGGTHPTEMHSYLWMCWLGCRARHINKDLEATVNEQQTKAEIVLPGFGFGDLNRFGKKLIIVFHGWTADFWLSRSLFLLSKFEKAGFQTVRSRWLPFENTPKTLSQTGQKSCQIFEWF